MCFTFIPADSPTVWMRFTPAKDTIRAAEVDTGADETLGVAKDTNEETAGVPISSVDQESQMQASQMRASQLAKREYQRDSIRMRKGRAMLSSLVRRLNIAQEIAQEKNVERASRKMSGPNLGLSSAAKKEFAETTGRCTDETAVDASVNVDLVGSHIKSSRVASFPRWRRPLWKGCRNHRLRCLKIDWLYCPSPAAGSDFLSLCQMTRSGTRRSNRVTSSQMSSNLIADSDQGTASRMANRSNNATGLLK